MYPRVAAARAAARGAAAPPPRARSRRARAPSRAPDRSFAALWYASSRRALALEPATGVPPPRAVALAEALLLLRQPTLLRQLLALEPKLPSFRRRFAQICASSALPPPRLLAASSSDAGARRRRAGGSSPPPPASHRPAEERGAPPRRSPSRAATAHPQPGWPARIACASRSRRSIPPANCASNDSTGGPPGLWFPVPPRRPRRPHVPPRSTLASTVAFAAAAAALAPRVIPRGVALVAASRAASTRFSIAFRAAFAATCASRSRWYSALRRAANDASAETEGGWRGPAGAPPPKRPESGGVGDDEDPSGSRPAPWPP